MAHSKKSWFDELHLSWVQLGEIIATWWEIRDGPCCVSTAVDGLNIRLTHEAVWGDSAAHTSAAGQGETKQDTYTDKWWILHSAAQLEIALLQTRSCGRVLEIFFFFFFFCACPLRQRDESEEVFCCCHHTACIGLCNLFPMLLSSGRANYSRACPDRYTTERSGAAPSGETH